MKWTKRKLIKALKDYDRSCPLDAESQGICSMSAWDLEAKLGGKVHGYHIVDNPDAEVGQNEEGHDFLVLDGFIVDWWYRSYYGGPGVYDLKKDAKEVRRLYGPRSRWVPNSQAHLGAVTIPMGDCFRWATQFAQKWPGSYVAHGICTNGPHAWVEVMEPDENGYPVVTIYDYQREAMGLEPMLYSDFQFQARPKRVKRYTPEEALLNATRARHWGPW